MDLKINPGFYYFLFASLKWHQLGTAAHPMPESTELAVWRLLLRAVELKIAPSWTLRGWKALRDFGRAFVVARLEAVGVTALSLPLSLPFESVCSELRRVSSAVRMWMARFDVDRESVGR